MLRADIEKALRSQSSGDFVNRQEIARAFGYKDPHSIDRYLKGLTRIRNKFHIKDVVDRVMEEERCTETFS